MADNYTAVLGDGTTGTFGADDVSSVLYPRVKLQIGADGERADVDGGQQTMANSVPVVVASDQDFVKAEDAAHSSGDKGIPALAVRKDTAAALAGTDGDYTPLESDASGRLHALAHSGATDDAAAAGQLYPVAGLYQATADEVDNGDVGRLRISARRGLVTVPDFRLCYATSNDVTQIGDMQANTAAWTSQSWGTPLATFFDGTDAGFGADARHLRIPMQHWSQVAVNIFHNLGVNLTIALYPLNIGYADGDGVYLPALASLVLATAGTATFAVGAGGAGAGANHIAVPSLSAPMKWLLIALTPASDPSAGRVSIRVTRS